MPATTEVDGVGLLVAAEAMGAFHGLELRYGVEQPEVPGGGTVGGRLASAAMMA